ncbi:hypothetical protein PO002_33585 [Cupriavidus necator]|uniref:hypothetical protein n=1 Tax=Cupriavidus necator TaxID=106590 RepID=UPI0039C47D9C
MSLPGLAANTAVLERLRLGGAVGDVLRTRQRLERALADVDWSPPGLAPRALLFVRRLRVDGRRALAPLAEGGTFARQVSEALRERAASARRPWLHRDAATAEAVCFTDEAELAACLWRDWVQGVWDQGWWWPGVLRRLGVRPWLRERLFTQGERLVPALALLAERGHAVACVMRLDEAEAAAAMRAVAISHAMRVPGGSRQTVPAPSVPVSIAEAPLAASSASVEGRARRVFDVPSPSLRRLMDLVPELRTADTSSSARHVLAAALALTRAAAWARSPAFVAALDELDEVPAFRLGDMSGDPRAVGDASPQEAAVLDHRVPQQAPQTVSRRDPQGALVRVPAPDPIASDPTTQRADSISAPQEVVESAREMASRDPADWPPAPAAPRANARPAAPAEAPSTSTVHTRLGGLFYLLNVALAWRVYGDFTMPREPGIALSPWDLLAWTGRAWFGEGFEGDPLWALLARLAGRELPREPGRDFTDAPDWVLPVDALAPWGEVRSLRVHATRHRLRIGHPQGFCVFDVAREAGLHPLGRARALCAAQPLLRLATFKRATMQGVPHHPGARWLHHWRVAVEARLRAALGDVDDVPSLVCLHRAEIAVGGAAVDISLSLSDLPLPVRFAGLDRDPGWIPAAGRSVMFHFR